MLDSTPGANREAWHPYLRQVRNHHKHGPALFRSINLKRED